MDDHSVSSLREALQHAPEDRPLRLLLAQKLLELNRLEDAEIEFKTLLLTTSDHRVKIGLATTYFELENYSTCNVILEELIESGMQDSNIYSLYAKGLLKENAVEKAMEVYEEALEMDSTFFDAELDDLFRQQEDNEEDWEEDREEENLVNPFTKTNFGWSLLEQGEHERALDNFKEALDIEPDNTYAKSGMLEALKATSPAYRLFLKYSFWISNLTAKYQWGFIIGFYVVFRLIRTLAQNNEALQPYLYPLLIFLAFLAFSTWVMHPIGNLFLRFHKYGKLLLDEKEKMSSNFVAISFCSFLAGILLYFSLSDERFLSLAIIGFAMMLPFSVMFIPSKYKHSLLIYAVVMAVIGIVAIGLCFSTGELFNGMSILFIIGFFAFQWVANFLLIRENDY